MAVFAIFTYGVKPGRLNDFMAKLGEAASQPDSPEVLRSVQLLTEFRP